MERIEAMPMEEARPAGRAGLKLALGAGLCLIAAGALLWWREGGDVFGKLVTSTLSWCL
ncbi:hypothetical protein [Enterovirga sp.]|uniref:hypothetical protein n=1 Tax=Enterovirga sp. TaxID=2026350 RepID=UPI002C545F0E|nr:hypothetical protein [Enterovirga sp.]HMO31253.1 hypothetical protein [Enterovirga sp.]